MAPHQRRGIRILLVSDSRDEREMYAECLRQEGFCTLQAGSEDDAYRLASELAPEIIVTSLKLPGDSDGLTLARRFKTEETTRKVPVVVLSGYGSQEYRHAARDAGCDLFLVKPCLPPEFVATITRLVTEDLLHAVDS